MALAMAVSLVWIIAVTVVGLMIVMNVKGIISIIGMNALIAVSLAFIMMMVTA